MSLPFRKFKLVPLDADEVSNAEDNLRKYDPTLRAMAHAYVGGKQALNSRLPAKTRLHLMTANRARFQRLMLNKLNEQQGLTRVELPVPQPAPKQMTSVDEMDPVIKEIHRPNVAIPKRHADKFENLIKLASDTIGVGENGEVVIRGVEVKNSSYSDVMRSLYSDAKGKPPILGLSETVGELKRLNIPSSMFTSSTARAIYKSAKQTGSGKCRFKPKMLRLY